MGSSKVPFCFRIVEQKSIGGVAGYAGRVFREICLEGRLHARVNYSELSNFKELSPQEENSVEFCPCTCREYVEEIPLWLERKLAEHLRLKRLKNR